MLVVLALHLLAAVAAGVLAPRWGSRALLLGALAPASGFGWLVTAAPGVLAGEERTEAFAWAPTLALEVPLRLDGLSLLLGLVVTGVGTAVLLYAVRYFADREEGMARTSATLVAFAGAMLALVLADHVLALYVAWELTTVCSFLLIGDRGADAGNRTAAVRALVVTVATGFAMLLGLLLLADAAGSYRLSEVLADPPTGPAAGGALVLVLVGAFGKAAQVPFHPWLPDAMVAATPVSAYLHAAAMVKAGIYLVARLAPAFAEVAPWRPLVLTVGVLTMLLGGWRALAQTDLKRLLAFGTIAQLGFLVVLLGAGTRTAALAGATLLLAHALFKSTLFMVVGIIDEEAGTRDLRELSGVRHRAPGLAAVAGLACLSMVGLPVTAGYLAKEAAFEAFVEPGPGHALVLAGIVAGSALTVAYTARFLWGAFADRPDVEPRLERPLTTFAAAPAVLAVAGVVLGALPAATDALAAGHAGSHPAEAGPAYHLELWHGLGPPVLLSLLTLVAGVGLHLARAPLGRARAAVPTVPGAQEGQDAVAAGVLAGAGALTRRTQVGALPVYLLVVLSAAVLGPGAVLVVTSGLPADVRWWDSPAQAAVGAVLVLGVVGVVAARGRLSAVLALSAVGFLVAALFVVQGAPDLALVQVLVETLTLLAFVLVVRRMAPHLPVPRTGLRRLRAAVAVAVGAVVALLTLTTGAQHAPSASTEEYFARAPEVGGPNVVNVIVTDFRALDTVGEITVLAIASTGVASLVLVSTRLGGAPRAPRTARREPAREEAR